MLLTFRRTYTKMEAGQLDSLICEVQADSRQLQLLHLLGPHVEHYVRTGKIDLTSLLSSLKTEAMMSEEEHDQLLLQISSDAARQPSLTSETGNKGTPLQQVVAANYLDAAVNKLINAVSRKVLGKKTLTENDTITVDGKTELPCSIFDRLRHDVWFDAWLILACMASELRPHVGYCYSVALDEPDSNGKERCIKRPLAVLIRKLEDFRRDARKRLGDETKLTYFCPLNRDSSDFSILEINERDRKIYHYDPMASEKVIQGTVSVNGSVELTRVGQLVTVS